MMDKNQAIDVSDFIKMMHPSMCIQDQTKLKKILDSELDTQWEMFVKSWEAGIVIGRGSRKPVGLLASFATDAE